ncbi:hypothetical protein [Jannaschia marina]|uniref:hypothetical protein n=1 Tax=Jannaschia marina TaxID=2741674 RepID=UPI0015C95B33|nr:hypothetical protein [Jannaschia marina]
MGIETLIGGLFLVTLLAAIAFAVWSKTRTERMMEKDRPAQPSPLARKEPDPRFTPDRDVTDPHRVASQS